MKGRYRSRLRALMRTVYYNIDDIQLLTTIPVVWSLVTSLFFLGKHPNTYIIADYPIIYYGLTAAVLAITVFSLFTMRITFKRIFFLVMVFGAAYSATDAFIHAQEPNITVGLFVYLFANSAYGYIRLSPRFQKKRKLYEPFYY